MKLWFEQRDGRVRRNRVRAVNDGYPQKCPGRSLRELVPRLPLLCSVVASILVLERGGSLEIERVLHGETRGREQGGRQCGDSGEGSASIRNDDMKWCLYNPRAIGSTNTTITLLHRYDAQVRFKWVRVLLE